MSSSSTSSSSSAARTALGLRAARTPLVQLGLSLLVALVFGLTLWAYYYSVLLLPPALVGRVTDGEAPWQVLPAWLLHRGWGHATLGIVIGVGVVLWYRNIRAARIAALVAERAELGSKEWPLAQEMRRQADSRQVRDLFLCAVAFMLALGGATALGHLCQLHEMTERALPISEFYWGTLLTKSLWWSAYYIIALLAGMFTDVLAIRPLNQAEEAAVAVMRENLSCVVRRSAGEAAGS